ncbi:MAG: YjzC family protein [Candidatus Babeliales bacterium]
MSKKDEIIQRRFNIGEICPESGVYRINNAACGIDNKGCVSEDQREIPLAKGDRFPPCRNCKGAVQWHMVRKA